MPTTQTDFTDLSDALERAGGTNTPCSGGYCAFSPTPGTALGNWWSNPATVDAMWPLGAAFGAYTGAVAAGGNAALANARFWVEVYPYSRTLNTQATQPSDDHSFVYQITVIARGLKAGTQVVLRSVIVRSPLS